MPVHVPILIEAMNKAGTNKMRMAREIGLDLRTVQTIFTEKKASPTTVMKVCEFLNVSPELVFEEYRKNLSDPNIWKTYEEFKAEYYSTPEQIEYRNSWFALSEYLDNAIITNPKSGELYRLNSTLLSVDNGSIKECIEQAITQWLTEHGYIE